MDPHTKFARRTTLTGNSMRNRQRPFLSGINERVRNSGGDRAAIASP